MPGTGPGITENESTSSGCRSTLTAVLGTKTSGASWSIKVLGQSRFWVNQGAGSAKVLEHRIGRCKERRPGHRRREIQYSIVPPGGDAFEHVLQHFFDDPQISGVADKVRPKFASARTSERHVVTQDVVFDAISVDDRRELLVRLPSGGVLQFDVIRFGSPDDALLRRGVQRMPFVESMQVLLHDNVTATFKCRVVGLDEGGSRQPDAGRIFGAVDKAEEVPGVEISKTLDLVSNRHGIIQGAENEPLEFKTHVGAIGPYVEQQIPRRCHRGMHGPADFGKRPQLCGTARLPQSIPGRTSDRHVAGKAALQVPEPDRPHQSADIGDHAAHPLDRLRCAADRQNQKHRCARQRCDDALRLDRNPIGGIDHAKGLWSYLPISAASAPTGSMYPNACRPSSLLQRRTDRPKRSPAGSRRCAVLPRGRSKDPCASTRPQNRNRICCRSWACSGSPSARIAPRPWRWCRSPPGCRDRPSWRNECPRKALRRGQRCRSD